MGIMITDKSARSSPRRGAVAAPARTEFRVAAIDVGSNSLHMVIAQADPDGAITTLWRMKEMVGLGRWGKTLVRKYSKGMSQRLGLAQAMLHDPDLLILDEPTDGVDPVGRAEIREVLARLKAEGKTIFLNSHLLQEVELICDRVAILGRGKLRRMDTVHALRQHTSLEAVLTLRADESSVRRLLKKTNRGIRRRARYTRSSPNGNTCFDRCEFNFDSNAHRRIQHRARRLCFCKASE